MSIFHKIKKTTLVISAISGIVAVMAINGCAESQKVKAKGGAQLWAENCQRCHNTPPPTAFSHEQWETLVMHMQTRAHLTESEKKKITEFLKQ